MSIPSRSRRGLTLLELLISGTLLILILGGVGKTSLRGLRMFELNSANNEINGRAGRVIDRVVRALIAARSNDVAAALETPAGAPTVWSTTLDFPTALEWSGGSAVWSATERISLEFVPGEIDNGLDDNGNGLIDEGRIVHTFNVGLPDESGVVLVNGVSELLEGETLNGIDDNGNGLIDEPGFCFSLEGRALRVRLTLEKDRGGEGQIIRSVEDSLTIRN